MFAAKISKAQTKTPASSAGWMRKPAVSAHNCFGQGEARTQPTWHLADIPLFSQDRAIRPVAPPLPSVLQAKLVLGPVGDPLEREADNVADQVMRMAKPEPVSETSSLKVSRRCVACEEEDKQKLQKNSPGGVEPHTVPPIVHQVLRSPGQPLDAASRAFFEPRFGHDFGRVRVHADENAAHSAAAVNAAAYTVGPNIVFNAGEYAPGIPRGDKLLAHELTHVMQQCAAPRLIAPIADSPGARSAGDSLSQTRTGTAHLSSGGVFHIGDSRSSESLQRWTYENSCSHFLTKLMGGDNQAKDMVQKAIDALSADPPPAWLDRELFNCFGVHKDSQNKADTIAGIVGVYKQIASHLSVGDYDYECSCQSCPKPSTDTGCAAPGEGPVVICLANMRQTTPAPTMVHEFSHRFAGTDDFSYCIPDCRGLDPSKSIGNAASYEYFADAAFQPPKTR